MPPCVTDSRRVLALKSYRVLIKLRSQITCQDSAHSQSSLALRSGYQESSWADKAQNSSRRFICDTELLLRVNKMHCEEKKRIRQASNLLAMVSNLLAMASTLIAIAM